MYGKCKSGYCGGNQPRYSSRPSLSSIYQPSFVSGYLPSRGSDSNLVSPHWKL